MCRRLKPKHRTPFTRSKSAMNPETVTSKGRSNLISVLCHGYAKIMLTTFNKNIKTEIFISTSHFLVCITTLFAVFFYAFTLFFYIELYF